MKRRVALLLVLGVCLTSVPAAAGSTRVPSIAAPVVRLLCGCDIQSAGSATAAVVRTRVSTISMSIVHVFRGCHVWALGPKTLGPTPTITVKAGSRLKLRMSCPMDFDLTQTAGPRLALGGSRYYAGTTRTIVFRKAGVYRLVARNVQTSEEIGLQTLGADNALRLTVRVK